MHFFPSFAAHNIQSEGMEFRRNEGSFIKERKIIIKSFVSQSKSYSANLLPPLSPILEKLKQ